MMAPRWRKVLADLLSNKTRTFLVVMSIGIGVFVVGVISSAYVMILNDLDAGYMAVNPYVATIYTDPFDEAALKTAERVPGVARAEGRTNLTARIAGQGGEWKPVQLIGIPKLDEMKINRLEPEGAPALPALGDHEMLVERSALALVPMKVGDMVSVESPDKRVHQVRVAGIVHDVTAVAGPLSGQVYAYANQNTIEWLGGQRAFNLMYLTVTERPKDEAHVKAVAAEVTSKIEKGGSKVYITLVYEPGKHWASSVVQALLALLGGLGVIALFLSGFLVINTIMALLSQHVRQIGMMKAIGARRGQLLAMYIVQVLGFGVLALVTAAPLAAVGGYGLSSWMAGFLNFDLLGFRVPTISLVLQLMVALVVPVVAALVPLFRGMRITVREALSSYGLSGAAKVRQGASRLGSVTAAVRRLQTQLFSRPLLISIRNTFRRRSRLILTLSTLTLAGAIFIAVFNLQAAFTVTINETLGYFLSDVNVELGRNYRTEVVQQLIQSVPGVQRSESWGVVPGRLLSADKETGFDILLWAPPANSTLIKPVMTAGRWLVPEDENAIVIGNHVLAKNPNLKVGDEFTTKILGKDYTWHVVGIFKMAGTVEPPFTYVNAEYLARNMSMVGRASSFRLVTDPAEKGSDVRVAKELQKVLEGAGIQISSITSGTENRAQQATSINILVYFLLAMAILIAVVGGLGLMGTMSMNVLERTREIGVMRAIGASNGAILNLVIVEGMLIGVISWLLGALLAVPMSMVMGYAVGMAFMTTPMGFVFSLNGFVIWLVVVLVLSALASILPALSGARLTVREVLAYE